ncbi:MAG: hypothetical protein LKM39_03215 [Chiayiivirga sp.]|jgi:hypothetical protein|nr:hypothetical protein [Chiayiivirga sp.]
MTRSATLTLAALALAALLLPCRAVSQSSDECEEWSSSTPLDEEVPLCDVVKSDADAGRFTIHELPDSSATFELRSGEGFLLHQECRASGAGLQCSGWPQEAKARGNLRYQWSFERRDQRTDHPESDVATRTIACGRPGWVTATLTVRNGKYHATSSESYYCGAHR